MPPFEFLGPYRIGETLGRGGMGTVYHAVHETTKEPVAVKLIAAHVADEVRFRRRFDKEVKTLQRLRHEGIVRLIGFGEEQGQLFYSMELVEGELLQARIKRRKKLDWKATIDISIEICSALKHAHDIGVIHRDLKPANIILTKNDHVKLVDFGIAKIFGDGEQTLFGSVLGTADYMAPEQTTSSGITVRTDLYALGSLMYAMLTGRPPFSGKSTTEVIESLKRDRPVPLDIINPELPEALTDLVHQLLEKDPADRPPTALAVMNRLKAMRAGLQRAQTMLSQESPTEIESDSSIGSDTDPSGIKSRSDHATDVTEEPTAIRQSAPVESNTGQASSAAMGDDASGGPTTPTEVSDTRKSKTVPPGGVRKETLKETGKETRHNSTHFQTVSDPTLPTSTLVGVSDGKSVWSHWMGVAVMLTLLLVGVAILVVAMRPPTADQLYLAATQNEDLGARKSFITRFPEDPRIVEVRDLYMSDQARVALNRLSAQERLGVKPLLAAEVGFMAAMQGREQSPRESSERIQQWLNAFNNEANRRDPNLNPLIQLAEYEQARLARIDPSGSLDLRVTELMKEIEAAEQLDDRAEANKRLQGIIETFEDQDWASPAVERARRAM